jgi:hypothetical protein
MLAVVSALNELVQLPSEAKAIGALNHSNICQVYDVGA